MEEEKNLSSTETSNEQIVNEILEEENKFSGEFHERDSLQENNIVEEVKTSFLEYSMSVITSRALPDLRDGLKPVNRRILWAMNESGLYPDKPHRKSATTVGYVMGNYHPHGDSSIYEAMVRMAQDFNQRYLMVDGHGNFGNIEGDGAAAMRYTESRLSKLSLEMLRDIDKDTVNMEDNFDFTKKEPSVLPSRFPNILVNGTMGIAVGMATNIPPHNLGEVIDGCVAYIDNHDIELKELMQYIKGPDFPTGGTILGNKGIVDAYTTGRGSITIRSKAEIIEENGKQQIIITEVPYGTNTFDLKQKVAELVHSKVLDGISDYHTDLKDGVKITITLKRDANAQVILNNLYKHTDFQKSYGIILLMLDNGVPRTLGLKSIISKYIDYQKEVIIRRTKYILGKAEDRVHILEGRKIALDHIDEVVNIIKNSKTEEIAKAELMNRFGLDDIQATDILNMRLGKLTGLEREAIENELKELAEKIKDYLDILAKEERVLGIIKEEMLEIKRKYGDERRTTIDMTAIDYIEDESLIPNDSVVIALTNNGYIKRTTLDTFRTQNRGGVGVKGMAINDEDYVKYLLNINTHDYVLFFSNKGKVYRIKGYEIPEYSRQSKGLPIINLLQIEKDEMINSVISISKEEELENLLFATKTGLIKKTAVSEFDNIRTSGKKAITLKENDELIGVVKVKENDMVLIGASNGRMVRFNENEIRCMGRTASGVKGINLSDGECIGVMVSKEDDKVLIVTEKGYGKQTNVCEYRETRRGSKGVKALNITDKNGAMVAFTIVEENKDVILITDSGMLIRMPLDQISTLGRVTQGVRLINIKDNQKLSTISLVGKNDEEDTEVTEGQVSEESVSSEESNTNE